MLRKYKLIEVEMQHLQQILEWRNSPRINSLMYTDHKISFKEHLEWYKRSKISNDIDVKLICYLEKPIGQVNFKIDLNEKKCFWGFYIGEENTPRGAGTVMGYLAISYIFEKYKVDKLYAEVISNNTISINFHKKMGFDVDAIFKNRVIKKNVYLDIVQMTLKKDKWFTKKKFLKEQLEVTNL